MQTTIPGQAESTTDNDSDGNDVHIASFHADLMRKRNIRNRRIPTEADAG